MVKKRVGAARVREKLERRLKAETQQSQNETGQTEEKGSQQQGGGVKMPAHLQRKLTRKVKFLDRVAASRAGALALRNPIKKRKGRRREGPGALGSLGTLAASLAEAAEEDTARAAKRMKGLGLHGTRKRRRLLQTERERLQTVCQSKVYISDPLAAISRHLEATLPPVPPAASSATSAVRLSKAEKKKLAAERRFRKQLDSEMAD